MANTYLSINLAGGSDDRRVKVSGDDTAAGFLEEKVVAESPKIVIGVQNSGASELLSVDVDETQIDHDILLNFEEDEHRQQDDNVTTNTTLWSSQKVQDELDLKVNKVTPITDNTVIKSIGSSGIDFEVTPMVIDDSGNVTGVNDLIVDGNLTVNGTTTSVNTTNTDIVDANITLNKGGTEASADAQDAGLTIEMSDVPDVTIAFDSTITSKFKIGEVSDEREVVTTSHSQTLLNKSINADSNTIENLEVDNLKSGVLSTDLDLAVDDTNLVSAQAVKDYVVARVAEKDEAIEIDYSQTTVTDWDNTHTDLQSSTDELASRINTTEDTLSNHLNGDPNKHNANQIANTASGNLVSTNVQDSLVELQLDVDTRALATDLQDHIDDITDAHDASAISNIPSGNITSIDQQSVNNELDAIKYNSADFDSDFDTRLATKNTDDLTEGVSNLYFTEERAHIESGDINNTQFNFSNNITSLTDITGLLINAGVSNSFEAVIYVNRTTDSLFETFEIRGCRVSTDWQISIESIGDDSGLEFDISSTGQIQYTSSDLTSGGQLTFKVKTTSV